MEPHPSPGLRLESPSCPPAQMLVLSAPCTNPGPCIPRTVPPPHSWTRPAQQPKHNSPQTTQPCAPLPSPACLPSPHAGPVLSVLGSLPLTLPIRGPLPTSTLLIPSAEGPLPTSPSLSPGRLASSPSPQPQVPSRPSHSLSAGSPLALPFPQPQVPSRSPRPLSRGSPPGLPVPSAPLPSLAAPVRRRRRRPLAVGARRCALVCVPSAGVPGVGSAALAPHGSRWAGIWVPERGNSARGGRLRVRSARGSRLVPAPPRVLAHPGLAEALPRQSRGAASQWRARRGGTLAKG